MRLRDAILKQLAKSSNSAVERVVEAALEEGSPAEQADLAKVLLERNRRSGWISLIRRFEVLPGDIQDRLLENPRTLFGPLSDAMDDGSGNGRANVIAIVRKSSDMKLLFLLTEALSDSRREVRTLAATSLLEAIRKHRESVIEENADCHSPTPPDPAQVRRTLDFALRQFRVHRETSAVLAALVFERQQDSSLWAFFNDPHDDLTHVATHMLRQLTDPALAGGVLLALGSVLKSAAIAGLSFTTSPAVMQAVARESYRLRDPLIGVPAQGIARGPLLMSLSNDLVITEKTWLGWVDLIAHLGLTDETKLTWYVQLDQHPCKPSRGQRLLLLRAIAQVPCTEALNTLVSFVSDADEIVARIAARYILARRIGDWRPHLPTLQTSPHLSVRKLVSLASSPGQFDRLWHQYLKLPPAVQLSTTRALSNNQADFPDMLKSKLASTSMVEMAQGLRMVQGLANIKPYRVQIIALCGHNDARIVASAVKLLGRLADPTLKDLLEAAARHFDPRVRANAIEAMEELHIVDRSQHVLTMLNSRHNRERANAIKAISQFDFSTARECLLKMLLDPSPQHRLSALWVVSQLSLIDIARQINLLARRDGNQHVRYKAQELLNLLSASAASTTTPSPEPSTRT